MKADAVRVGGVVGHGLYPNVAEVASSRLGKFKAGRSEARDLAVWAKSDC